MLRLPMRCRSTARREGRLWSGIIFFAAIMSSELMSTIKSEKIGNFLL